MNNQINYYHVTYDKNQKKWKVQRVGTYRATGYYNTRQEAESIAKRLAKQFGTEVIIHNKTEIVDLDTMGENESNVKDKKF